MTAPHSSISGILIYIALLFISQIVSAEEIVSCGLHAIENGTDRRAGMRESTETFCKAIQNGKPWNRRYDDTKSWSHYVSSESAKVVFAVNYKVMSTSVLSIVHALDHDGEILFEPDVPKAYGNPFNELSRSEQEARLAGYTRVLIVRNPFARLYSAWSNKFPEKAANFCEHRLRASGEEYYYCDTSAVRWARIGQRFFKHAGVPVPETSREQLLGVTWRMFLNGVLDEAVFDMHWEPQVDLTRLCWFKPDFVMDVEHSDEDLVALFAQLSETGKWYVAGTLNPGMFRSNPSHTSLSSPSRSLRARLNYAELYTAEDVTRIVQKYRDDFTALGYSPRIDCV